MLTEGVKIIIIILASRLVHAGVAELADALDLGSSVYDVKVQVLSPAPSDLLFAGVAQW